MSLFSPVSQGRVYSEGLTAWEVIVTVEALGTPVKTLHVFRRLVVMVTDMTRCTCVFSLCKQGVVCPLWAVWSHAILIIGFDNCNIKKGPQPSRAVNG